jgi:hypothetical protein
MDSPTTIINGKTKSRMNLMVSSFPSATRDILVYGHIDDIWSRGSGFVRILLIPQNDLVFLQ